MDEPIVLDSSGWIEWLSSGAGAAGFAPAVAVADRLIVPAMTIFEVVRWALSHGGQMQAEAASELLQRGTVVDLDANLAIAAAMAARTHRLPTADSIIYATARRFGAELWTQDADFEGLSGVRYFAKISRP